MNTELWVFRESVLPAQDGHSGEGDRTSLLEGEGWGGMVLSPRWGPFHVGNSLGPFQESGKHEKMAEALV